MVGPGDEKIKKTDRKAYTSYILCQISLLRNVASYVFSSGEKWNRVSGKI